MRVFRGSNIGYEWVNGMVVEGGQWGPRTGGWTLRTPHAAHFETFAELENLYSVFSVAGYLCGARTALVAWGYSTSK